MKCEEANKLDLVEYLFSLGFTPTKIRGNNYWYISPLRDEKEASFKIDRNKKVWYDHGAGKGGTVVDFVMQYFNCDVSKALQKIADNLSNNQLRFVSTDIPSDIIFPKVSQPKLFDADNSLFQQQNTKTRNNTNHQERPPFHLHENSLINHKDAAETAIEIIAAKKPITDLMLCRYLKERRIDKNIADKYCYEIVFKFSNKDAKHTAIGFKNSAGGYELRNDFFKLSSSPKYVTHINNVEQKINSDSAFEKENFQSISDDKKEAAAGNFNPSNREKNEDKNEDENLLKPSSIVSQKNVLESCLNSEIKDQIKSSDQSPKQSKFIAVFEGFFDFLTYQTIHQNQKQPLTDFLVLNSLAFFERSLLLMEKHEHVHLYLDHDEAGKRCVGIALKRSPKYKDESILYEGYKDLNDWVMHFGKLHQKESLKQSKRMGLP